MRARSLNFTENNPYLSPLDPNDLIGRRVHARRPFSIQTLKNIFTVLIGTSFGLVLKNRLSGKIQKIITQGIGLGGPIPTQANLTWKFSLRNQSDP